MNQHLNIHIWYILYTILENHSPEDCWARNDQEEYRISIFMVFAITLLFELRKGVESFSTSFFFFTLLRRKKLTCKHVKKRFVITVVRGYFYECWSLSFKRLFWVIQIQELKQMPFPTKSNVFILYDMNVYYKINMHILMIDYWIMLYANLIYVK